MTYQDLFINLIECLVIVFVISQYFNKNNHKYQIILFILLYLEVNISNMYSQFDVILPYIMALTNMIITKLFTNVSIYEISAICLLEDLTHSCVIVFASFLSHIININWFLMCLFIQINHLFICYFVFWNIKRKVYDLEIIYWKYITMFVFIFNLSFTVIIQSYLGMKMKTVYYLVVFLSLYMTTLGIYWMVFQMNKINKEKVNREYTIKKLQLKQENDKYIKSVNEQLQMIRHDLKHDYELIQYYLDNQEYIKIQELLEYKGIYLSNMHSISCDNKVIESVINTKIIKANKNHKKIYCQITYKGQLKIREHHLYQVLCNLIDNAIEYGDQDYLDVKIDFDNIILLIQVSNPLLIQTTFQTKKNKQEHGFGLKNIEKIVNEYQGTMIKKQENEMLEIILMIPNK